MISASAARSVRKAGPDVAIEPAATNQSGVKPFRQIACRKENDAVVSFHFADAGLQLFAAGEVVGDEDPPFDRRLQRRQDSRSIQRVPAAIRRATPCQRVSTVAGGTRSGARKSLRPLRPKNIADRGKPGARVLGVAGVGRSTLASWSAP